MAAFISLEDSPMFQKQVFSLEGRTDELKVRCQRLYKGVKKFMGALGEASTGFSAFADSLEEFGAGHDDPVSVSIGGPVISKFINTLRELSSYKEFLRSHVEHVLLERLTNFMTVDLQEAKESRRRFDKAVHSYDQARKKFVALKKNTRGDIVAVLEDDLENSKSAFEKSRFNLGYDLLSELKPYIYQVLTYAQQSKEQSKIEQDRFAIRILEFRTQSELDSQQVSAEVEPSGVDRNVSYRTIPSKNVEVTLIPIADKEVRVSNSLISRKMQNHSFQKLFRWFCGKESRSVLSRHQEIGLGMSFQRL